MVGEKGNAREGRGCDVMTVKPRNCLVNQVWWQPQHFRGQGKIMSWKFMTLLSDTARPYIHTGMHAHTHVRARPPPLCGMFYLILVCNRIVVTKAGKDGEVEEDGDVGKARQESALVFCTIVGKCASGQCIPNMTSKNNCEWAWHSGAHL